MKQKNSHFREEFGIIPRSVYLLAAIGIVCALGFFVVFIPHHDPSGPPPAALRPVFGLLMGTVLAAYLLLVGYVNQDAKRRNMGQLLWTLLVIFIPNGIGFLAYFLLRKPLIQHCPRCGERVEKDFHFCAKCGCTLAPACEHCGRKVSRDFVVCPYCGKALGAAAPTG